MDLFTEFSIYLRVVSMKCIDVFNSKSGHPLEGCKFAAVFIGCLSHVTGSATVWHTEHAQ